MHKHIKVTTDINISRTNRYLGNIREICIKVTIDAPDDNRLSGMWDVSQHPEYISPVPAPVDEDELNTLLPLSGDARDTNNARFCECVYVCVCVAMFCAWGLCVCMWACFPRVCVCVCFWVCVWTNLDVCNWSNPPFCHGKAIFLPILPLCAGLLSSLHTKVIYGFIQGKQYSRRTKNTCSSYSNHQIYPHGRMHARNKISYIQKQISTSVLLFCREEELGPWWLCLIWNKWLYWIRSVEGKATWR